MENSDPFLASPGTAFIIRIYRIYPIDGGESHVPEHNTLIGSVEYVQCQTRFPFKNIEELWSILSRNISISS